MTGAGGVAKNLSGEATWKRQYRNPSSFVSGSHYHRSHNLGAADALLRHGRNNSLDADSSPRNRRLSRRSSPASGAGHGAGTEMVGTVHAVPARKGTHA